MKNVPCTGVLPQSAYADSPLGEGAIFASLSEGGAAFGGGGGAPPAQVSS